MRRTWLLRLYLPLLDAYVIIILLSMLITYVPEGYWTHCGSNASSKVVFRPRSRPGLGLFLFQDLCKIYGQVMRSFLLPVNDGLGLGIHLLGLNIYCLQNLRIIRVHRIV